MNIRDFESEIDERILMRGNDYFENGKISNLQTEGNCYTAIAHGTDDYKVEAVVDENGEIIDCSCDCPYEDGEICKHEVALFFAIRAELASHKTSKKRAVSNPEQPIDQLIKTLSRAQLETLLLTFCSRFEDAERQIRFYSAEDEKKLKNAKALIQSHIRQARRKGFIEESMAGPAFAGVDIVYEEARNCDQLKTAIALCLLGLEAVETIENIDDSDGVLGIMSTIGQETIDQLLKERLVDLPIQEQQSIFANLYAFVQKYWQSDLSFSGGLLIETLLLFCHDPVSCSEYDRFLTQLEETVSAEEDSYSRRYHEREIELLRFHFIALYGTSDQRQIFIEKHIQNPDIREFAINECLSVKQYDRALSLIEEGRLLDKNFLGIVKRWDHLAYMIHIELNQTEEIRLLSTKFLLDGEIEFYDSYLSTFPKEEHELAVQKILSQFEQMTYATGTYIQILIKENELEKLMLLCEKEPEKIESLYVHLLKSHQERVRKCFILHIRTKADLSSDRSAYQRVCHSIRVYRKAFGDSFEQIVNELKDRYPRRPAMQDELNRMLRRKTV